MKAQAASKPGFLSRAFNLSILDKKRMAWVDYLKGIAIVLVVYRHVLVGIQRSVTTAIEHGAHIPTVPEYLEKANMIFFSFRMPLFFILSGIFISGSLAKRTLKQVIGIKFENLLYPYFIWVTLQITVQILLGGSTNANRSWIDYTYIFWQPRSLDQFWYLPALFNTTAIYLLVKTYLKPPMWAQFIIGAVLYFLSPHCTGISMIADWMEFYIFFALGDAIAPYFWHERTGRFLSNGWVLLAITPIFFLTQVYYLSRTPAPTSGDADFLAIALIGCLSMFILAYRMQSWGTLPFLRVIGYHSLYIYVTHVFVAGLVRLVLTHVLHIHTPFVLLGMGIFFSILVPIVFYNLLILDGPLWWTFAFRKEKPQPKKVPPPTVHATV